MDCINCNKPLVGRKKLFCSDKCRMRHKRADAAVRIALGIKPEQAKAEQPKLEQPELPRILTVEMLASLPVGVVHPTAQPNIDTANLTAYELEAMVQRAKHWQSSVAYAETVYRLLTMSKEELEESGQFIPCWKAA